MDPRTLGLLLSLPKVPHSNTFHSSVGLPCHHRPPFFFNRAIICSGANSKPQPPPSQPVPPLPPLPGLSLLSISDWADSIKERGMQQRRQLYTHEKWVEHRSSRRHVRHVASSLSSRVIVSLIPPVLVFTSVAVLVAAYNSAVSLRLLPEFLPLLHAPALPYQLTAPALALLLVFRTEASYSRFEEARRTWAKVIAGARDLARAAAAWVSLPEDEHLRDAIIQYVMAFPLALKCHVIYGSNFEKDLGTFLDQGDLAVVMRSKHRPRCILGFISQCLQLAHLDDSKRNSLVGVLIEEPFPVLPLAELCNLACESIQESLATEESIRRQLQAKRKIGSETSTACSPNGWPMSERDPS
ncbi:UPF0187 protein At3g61320, chloroplastic-like isoform X2 [Nymphaea colorata]|uniref:UPF0187 protein At3g61320, chloroplastic-like isoform X2 n=1 Tax=Nymphaea colorata TaxID=210225 RepID=UPI00129D50C7|nr:UPF0187 protein At3g61320, chloroplastic-like isoform X2 [Nymphaea colorata]